MIGCFEVLPGIHCFWGGHGTFNTFAYLLDGDAPLLVDAIVAESARTVVLPALQALKISPAGVIITHGHADHFGGAAAIVHAYPEVTVAAHSDDVPWIEDVDLYIDQMYRQYGREAGFAFSEQRLAWVRTLISGPVRVQEQLGAGHMISTGRFHLQVVHLPGHSAGHIGLVDSAGDFAIIGDAVLGQGVKDRYGERPFAPLYYDVQAYRQSLKTIRDMQAPLLLTGHIPLLEHIDVNRYLQESEHFVEACHDHIYQALCASSQGLSFPELCAFVDTALGPYTLGLPGFPCVLAHLRELEQQGLVLAEERNGQRIWYSLV